MERIIELKVPVSFDGKAIKTVLKRELGASEGLITSLKHREGAVLLGGEARPVTVPAAAGDIITLRLSDEGERGAEPVSGPVEIIYEDEDILLVNKPPRLLCHPVRSEQRHTLANYLTYCYNARGEHFIARIITRLDSGTSGLVLLGKNALVASLLSEAAAKGGIEKEYLAVCVGAPKQTAGEISSPIRRCTPTGIKREVCAEGGGSPALTGYELLAQRNGLSLIRALPQTGRTHQIRVHLASIGLPLAGDFLYGEEDAALISRPALHMQSIGFAHPLTKEALRFTAPLPEDMAALFPEYFGVS